MALQLQQIAQLSRQLGLILPPEGHEYFEDLNRIRFHHRPEADRLFLHPDNLLALLADGFKSRGGFDGDDRHRMEMLGIPAEAFDLSTEYRYLQVPAEGRVGMMPLSEMPEWVPVTVQEKDGMLTFTVDSEFQRSVNYATVILAPNWFDNPSSEMAVMDVMPGYPPYGTDSLPKSKKHPWHDGQQLQVTDLRKIMSGKELMLGCRLRNMPARF